MYKKILPVHLIRCSYWASSWTIKRPSISDQIRRLISFSRISDLLWSCSLGIGRRGRQGCVCEGGLCLTRKSIGKFWLTNHFYCSRRKFAFPTTVVGVYLILLHNLSLHMMLHCFLFLICCVKKHVKFSTVFVLTCNAFGMLVMPYEV
jgi:hypothetical protein